MREIVKKPLYLFSLLSLVLATIFFLLPINLFDGVIEYEEGIRSYKLETPLSLSYFIGLGYEESEMEFVKDFYLTTKGIFMAIIFILGIPGIITYRVHLSRKREDLTQK